MEGPIEATAAPPAPEAPGQVDFTEVSSDAPRRALPLLARSFHPLPRNPSKHIFTHRWTPQEGKTATQLDAAAQLRLDHAVRLSRAENRHAEAADILGGLMTSWCVARARRQRALVPAQKAAQRRKLNAPPPPHPHPSTAARSATASWQRCWRLFLKVF